MRTIKKAVIKNKVIIFAREMAFCILAGIFLGAGFVGVVTLYCRIAGPLLLQ